MPLYRLTAKMTYEVVTLVNAEHALEARAIASTRPVLSVFDDHHTDKPEPSALSDWLSGVPLNDERTEINVEEC